MFYSCDLSNDDAPIRVKGGKRVKTLAIVNDILDKNNAFKTLKSTIQISYRQYFENKTSACKNRIKESNNNMKCFRACIYFLMSLSVTN